MRDAIRQAINDGIAARRKVLAPLSSERRMALLSSLFSDLFGHQHVVLQKWGALTGQSAQVDTGYIAQFAASIVLGEPGQGFRGKGDDLADGSEVKSAANTSGVDTPRWNHNLGKIEDDLKRRAKGEKAAWETYLSSPHLFYLLVDRPTVPTAGSVGPVPLRIRAWCIDAQHDPAWRALVETFVASREGSTYNFQLHPPVGRDDDLVVNTLGSLDFSEVLLFEARLDLSDRNAPQVSWPTPLSDDFLPIQGRSISVEYTRAARGGAHTTAADLLTDAAIINDLFPELTPNEAAAVSLAEVVAPAAGGSTA